MTEIPVRFELETIGASLPLLQKAARRTLPLTASVEENGTWEPLRVGDQWGAQGETRCLRIPVRVPEEWTGDVVAHIQLGEEGDLSGPEALAYLDGQPLQGLDMYHRDLYLTGRIKPGEDKEVLLEAYSSLRRIPPTLTALSLQQIDPDANALYHDMRVFLGTVRTLHPDSLDRAHLTNSLVAAYRALDLREPGSNAYICSARKAHQILQGVAERHGELTPCIVAVGHAHIDLAWLWPVEQTRRKGARTFSTALRLMERYPDFRFVASQPALYKMLKEDEPGLYAQIKERIKEGRWEPVGATWVEMDCNVTSGESLVRQFMFGTRFFQQEFGIRPRVLWLPDTFGYSAALPEIMRGAGVDAFMTTKISWNEYNRLPHDTFRWRGLDGSEVLTHMVTAPMIPADLATGRVRQPYTYNAMFLPGDLAGDWQAYRQKRVNDELLYLFGYGDGGGGPTAEMQETAKRLKDVAGFPRVEQSSAQDYFTRLYQHVWDNPELPRWVGELYLEYHRGTYTSQGWIKRANRKAEILYRGAELWSAMAGTDLAARQTELNVGWEEILFNQFHDILPGSSIHQVYQDARESYERIEKRGRQVARNALAAIESKVARDEECVLVFNPAPFARQDYVEMALPRRLPGTQAVGGDWHLVPITAPAHGYALVPMSMLSEQPNRLSISRTVLENDFFRLEFNVDATIKSIFDKRAVRDVLVPDAKGNQLVAYEDRPLAFDAWDIQMDYQDKPYPISDVTSWDVVEEGPLRGGVEIVRRYEHSTITQRVLLYRDVPRIDFPTEIEWHEHQTLLKAAFPVDINADHARFEIQFGNVERPTHWNTSWDWARFESLAHRWVNMSEGDYGVSLLNDSKYGHDVHDNVMRLTLLKSGIEPDPEADQGHHEFSYALLPHLGSWRQGDTVKHAYLFNMPAFGSVVGRQKGSLPAKQSFVSTDRPGLVIDTVKPAEDGDGIIVRVYDSYNTRGDATLVFSRAIESAEETNLLEEQTRPATIDGNELRIGVRPYGIGTYRVRLAPPT